MQLADLRIKADLSMVHEFFGVTYFVFDDYLPVTIFISENHGCELCIVGHKWLSDKQRPRIVKRAEALFPSIKFEDENPDHIGCFPFKMGDADLTMLKMVATPM